MCFQDKLKSTQTIAYKTLYNAFNSGKRSHIYLISGDSHSPLKETALFIAKSFLCEQDVLACENCHTCKSIDNKSYPDFKFINEEGNDILKDDIISLQEEFALTALAGKAKVYIIHLIENGGAFAMNKLLKFIEEPSEDVYGILTTKNISKVLPTIISRCQVIKLIDIDKNDLKNDYIKEGIPNDDAYILSQCESNLEKGIELYKDEKYSKIRNNVLDSFDLIINKKDDLLYYAQRSIYPMIDKKNNESIKIYLDMLNAYLLDYLLDSKNITFNTKLDINDKEYLENVISKIMITRSKLDGFLNDSLLLDRLFIDIIKKER